MALKNYVNLVVGTQLRTEFVNWRTQHKIIRRKFMVSVRATKPPHMVLIGVGDVSSPIWTPTFVYLAEEGYVRIEDYTVTEIHQ